MKALEAFEAGYWGQISGHHAKLATQLGAGHSILRIFRGRAPDRLHHECHRGAEFEAVPGGAYPWPFPRRRRRHEAAISGAQQRRLGGRS